MISMEELLKDYKLEDQPEATQKNLQELLTRVNIVRQAWGKPMTVTSGLRTPEDQIRIYKAKGNDHPPMGSKHLVGAAVDIYDPQLELTAWLKSDSGSPVLHLADLYCEEGNSNWVHFQIYPPASNKRWFLP